jgi:zinc protease
MRLFRTGVVALATLTLGLAAPAAAQRTRTRASDAIRIPFERYVLKNGLTVVLAPDHSTPTVAVEVYYHVGSKNEIAGRTGFAHLFEHVMFTGSGNAPYGTFDRLTTGVGGRVNAYTTNDETVYAETIPSGYLESTLWLESDRMGFLLDNPDSARFGTQRDVVRNERRQNYDNPPYARFQEIIPAAMYPPAHRYSWQSIGYMADLRQASVADVEDFFRRYYTPPNATLTIVGDFDPSQAKRWVAKYFSDLPRGEPIARPEVRPATVTREQRLVFEDHVQVPRLYFAWPTGGAKNNDTYALNVLASILAGTRTARLTKALAYDRQSATLPVVGVQREREDAGEFYIWITPRTGHTLGELEATADSIIERFKHEGPTAEELQRAIAGLEFDFVSKLESSAGKAEVLSLGASYFGDPSSYRTQYTKLKSVTYADVKRVANTYLGPGRVVLSVVPEGKPELASKPEASAKVTLGPEAGQYIMGAR